MALIEIVREVPLTPHEAWRRVTHWRRHAQFVPLTSIRLTSSGFIARTGLGPFGFDDPMEIVEWDEPRRCRLEKYGRVVTGWAELRVEDTGASTRVVWREQIHVAGIPAIAEPLTRFMAARLFARVVDGLLSAKD